MKHILITGVNSYIGCSVSRYLEDYNVSQREEYRTEMISLRGEAWKKEPWNGYDCVLHVAGLAHADIGRLSGEEQRRYYEINCDLAVQALEKAKRENVGQFIYMSSVIVYGDSAPVGRHKHITGDTIPSPSNFYGDSKWQAEKELEKLAGDTCFVAIVRAPMVYGKDSRGNFPMLARLADKMPVFPALTNERSVLYIENLAEFLRLLIESGQGGVFFPQNREYAATARIVQEIAAAKGKRIPLWRALDPFVRLAGKMPGKAGAMANKAFGSLTVDQELSVREIDGYQRYSLEESIRRIYGGQL